MAKLRQVTAFGPGVYRGQVFTPERLRSFVEGSNRAIAAGVPIPLLKVHAPINASDNATFDAAKQTGAGWITQYFVDKSGALGWEADNVPEAVASDVQAGTMKFTSPEFRNSYASEKDGVYEGPIIRHMAFTSIPGNPHQGAVEQVDSIALSEAGVFQFSESDYEGPVEQFAENIAGKERQHAEGGPLAQREERNKALDALGYKPHRAGNYSTAWHPDGSLLQTYSDESWKHIDPGGVVTEGTGHEDLLDHVKKASQHAESDTLPDEIYKHIADGMKHGGESIQALQKKFAPKVKYDRLNPLAHPVNAALRKLHDAGRVSMRGDIVYANTQHAEGDEQTFPEHVKPEPLASGENESIDVVTNDDFSDFSCPECGSTDTEDGTTCKECDHKIEPSGTEQSQFAEYRGPKHRRGLFHELVARYGGKVFGKGKAGWRGGDSHFELPESQRQEFHRAARAAGFKQGEHYEMGESQHAEEDAEAEENEVDQLPPPVANPDMPPVMVDLQKLQAYIAGMAALGVLLPSTFTINDPGALDVLLTGINTAVKSKQDAEAQQQLVQAPPANVQDAAMPYSEQFSEAEYNAMTPKVRAALDKAAADAAIAKAKAEQFAEDAERTRNAHALENAKRTISTAKIPPALRVKLLAGYDTVQFSEGAELPTFTSPQVAEMVAAIIPPSLQFDEEAVTEAKPPKTEQFFESGELSGNHIDPARAEEIVAKNPALSSTRNGYRYVAPSTLADAIAKENNRVPNQVMRK